MIADGSWEGRQFDFLLLWTDCSFFGLIALIKMLYFQNPSFGSHWVYFLVSDLNLMLFHRAALFWVRVVEMDVNCLLSHHTFCHVFLSLLVCVFCDISGLILSC